MNLLKSYVCQHFNSVTFLIAKEPYTPSWSKPKIIPDTESDGIPQWKKDLAERRKQRKDSDTPAVKKCYIKP